MKHFIQESLRSFFILKKIGAFHPEGFLKHPLFITFSLFFILSEVCNVSSKYWLPYKLGNHYFYTGDIHIPQLHKKYWRS